eukprot:4717663-Prorocentrum_lima.AAC.1
MQHPHQRSRAPGSDHPAHATTPAASSISPGTHQSHPPGLCVEHDRPVFFGVGMVERAVS